MVLVDDGSSDRTFEIVTEAAAKDPRIVERLEALGINPIGSTPEEMEATIAAEKPLYKEAVDAAGLTMAQ